MPVLYRTSYRRPPAYQFNGHLQTVLPAVLRKVEAPFECERIGLPDGDHLDLDWITGGGRRLAILTHGLEGNSRRHYMKGMARLFASRGWDVLAWNCRTCNGEMNQQLRMYHHGDIDDIGHVVRHALRTKDYEQVVLIGFSMGASILLKYLGVHGNEVPDAISKGIAFSAPCDLEAGVRALERPANRFYKKRFLKSLRPKIEAKAELYPDVLDASKFDEIREWRDFDNFFSAPINGYSDAEEFYYNSSAKNFMAGTDREVLVVNAKNDPILLPECSPVKLAEKHPKIFLEMPRSGGHVGFALSGNAHTWSEYRALEFAEA
ncbi:MAG: alpha/beta fold hydrolase [Phaeodactylibacter sp.]|nr:alpha/beta fold hydrolase [Phaeodactylibacter sp.]MCB9275499.1 alpha/beta fold hydrolase [Lewinellaceae bacterium]